MPQDIFNKSQKTEEKTKIPRKTPSIITGSYLPEKIVTNEDIIAMGLDTTSAALKRSLGCVERRAAASGETGADMMAKVAMQILEKANLSPEDIDLIICSSDPGDAAEPETATVVQGKLGASCPAFGVSMSCVGWIAGIEIALNYLTLNKKRILVLASSLLGSRIFFRDLNRRAIFGDAAGGILLEPHNVGQFLSMGLWTNGQHYSKIYAPYPWSVLPEDIPPEYKDSFYMFPDQRLFFSAMDSFLASFVRDLLIKAEVTMDDINLFLLHYPSKPLFERSLKLLDIPRSKTITNFERYGNLVAADMPILLHEAINEGLTKEGDYILCITYGAGFTMGGFVMRC